MQLLLQKIDKNEKENLEKSFSDSFLKIIQPPYYNQKLYKFLTYKEYFKADEETLLKIDSEHYYQWKYVSTSYTWDTIFLAISEEKIGIDVEEIKERSQEMLDFFSDDEYAFIWEKSRKNFFLLRTAEECLIKTSNACFFEDWKNVKIKSYEKKNQEISGIKFSREWIMQLHDKQYKVYSWITDNKVYSIWLLK